MGQRRWRGVTGVEPRGGAAPEMAIPGLPGVKKDEIWVGRGLRDTRSPPEAFAGLGEAGSGARCVGGGPARRSSPARRVQAVLVLGCGRKGVREALRSKRKTTRAYAGLCGAAEAWPWRSGGGGTPAAVLCQPRGLRPNCLGAKGGTGLQGAHRGVAVDGAAAQGGRRRSPGGGRGRRSRRRSLQRLEWSAAGPGKLQRSRRSRGAGVAERRSHGGAERRHGGVGRCGGS